MPTGVLSLGTIAQRLRAAADSSTLSPVDIENLAACAQTLEGGWPSTKQLRAITSVVESLAPVINTPQFWRCVSSLDYWVSKGRPPKKPAPASRKPDWMVHNEEVQHAASAAALDDDVVTTNTSAWAIAGAINVILDEIVSGDYVDETWLALDALIRTLKRLA